MKKSLLSLSIGAFIGGLTLAGAANAATSVAGTGANLTAPTATGLALNAGGIGHIGIIPYFSTQNGNHTLISITNTDTVNGKAVKVRFRSAANSDDVFDFTLFLSPGDVWTADVSRDATTGLSQLFTADNSCTLPAAPALNRTFITDRLPAVTTSFTADTRASWTREGYIEVLNMADVPPVFAAAQTYATYGAATTTNALYTTTKHNTAGAVACDSAVLSKLVTNAALTEAQLGALGLDSPTGGLYTNAFIINSANAYQAWSTEATAVQAVNGTANAIGRVVFAGQTSDAVTVGTAATLTADPLLAAGTLSPIEFDFPDLSTPYTGTAAASAALAATQATNLSAALAVTSIKNDYSTLAAIGSKTDFTFSMPTRRYAAAVNYAGTAPALVFNAANAGHFAAANTTLSGNLACVAPGIANAVTGYSRSEQFLTSGAVVSPGTASALRFCGEVSVLTINNDANAPAGKGVLGATVAVQNVYTSYQEGWVNISTPGLGAGLPVLGSAYTSAVGAAAAGLSTNYGWTYAHKFTK
ncbi:cell surface protein [Xylophilus sp. GW821-FHT01B05]